MKWAHIKEFQGLVIQTNLSSTINGILFAQFQIFVYFLQLSYFLIEESNEQVFLVIKHITKISLISPYFMDQLTINIIIGIIITIINLTPYTIITLRFILKTHQNVESISKSVQEITTVLINNYFLNFTWIFYMAELYYICWNLQKSINPFLLIISIINLVLTLISLLLSNIFFVNYEFFEQNMRRHYNHNNVIAQLIQLPLVFISQKNEFIFVLLTRISFGFFLFLLILEGLIQIPFGFSVYGQNYSKGLTAFLIIYIITTIKTAFNINIYTCIIFFIILIPVTEHLISAMINNKRHSFYQIIENANQYFELLYIENMFELSNLGQKDKAKEIEFITKFSMHYYKCNQIKCQCKKIGFENIIKQDKTVIFVACLFKRSFDRHKNEVTKNIFQFESISLKFLTFINKYKRNGPKTYQELKVLFQKERKYSFYFFQMCLFLQFIIQAQMQKDEDYNVNSEFSSRISNVKLQVSKSERSIVQTLYQMDQLRQNMLPLLIQVCQFKSNFWKGIQTGKIQSLAEIEKEMNQLTLLKQELVSLYELYRPVFFVNGRTYNVQFVKYDALIQLILFNNARAYYEMEKDCREILMYEKNMSTFEITNINFFKGDAISVKVVIANGPNIGKVRNEIISPLIPKFFGFSEFKDPMQAFLEYTQGNINPLMPNWLLGVHDEMMQNYIRRGTTQRIGKYFQTFAKLCDKTLIRCQVYLAHNFSLDLEADFSMIGCLKRLEQDNVEIKDDSTKRLKNLVFKGQQHVLFDMYGNLMGITQGLYKMIQRMQRKINNNSRLDEVQQQQSDEESSSSENSSSEQYDIYNEKRWSNQELNIDEFYLKVLIWMMFPFITAEMEQTGIEFLMNGQIPPKGKYPNLIDLESGNTVVSNKETFMFIPEDFNLFIQQYNKVLQKLNEEDKISTVNYSVSRARQQYDEQFQQKQQATIFNEKLCCFFYEEHLKNNQTKIYGTVSRSQIRLSNLQQVPTTIIQASKDEESSESEGQLKSKAEQMYYDKFQKYIEKISIQDFNPVPIIYSINYEEYRYKKNEIENKVQMFVIELIVNEQQLQSMDKEYRKQLRENLKNMQQQAMIKQGSNLSYMKQSGQTPDKSSKDSISIQGNISEQIQVESPTNHFFLSHPSKHEEFLSEQTEQYILTSAKDENYKLLSSKANGNIRFNENGLFSNRSDISEKQEKQHFGILKFQEKELASKVVSKLHQRNKQQKFFNENEQRMIQSNADQDNQQIEIENSYFQALRNFDENFIAVSQKLQQFQYPNAFKFQKYLLNFSLLLVITFVIVVSITVWNQYDYTECYNLIKIVLNIQQQYSYVAHGLFRIQYTNNFNIEDSTQVIQFYEQLVNNEIQELITYTSQYSDQINNFDFSINIYFDIDNNTLTNPSLTETISQSLAQFYKILEFNQEYYQNSTNIIQISVANLQEIGYMAQLAYDQCYYTTINNESYKQNLLIIIMVIIFVLVLILQFTQIPMITQLGKYKRKIYTAVLDVTQNQTIAEYETYDLFISTLKQSIYDWMMMDFIQEGRVFDFDLKNGTSEFTKLNSEDQNNNNKSEKHKLIKKLKLNIQQVKYILILSTGLVVIMSYFLLIFLLVYLISSQLESGLEQLFQFKMMQSSFLNIMGNFDLVAYKTLENSTLYFNIITQEQFSQYSSVLQGISSDFNIQYGQNGIDVLSDDSITNQIKEINENNICSTLSGLQCDQSLVATLNSQYLLYFQFGLKYLLSQVDKIIQSNPQYFEDSLNNNTSQEYINFVSAQDHITYIDYGTEILVKAYTKIVDLSQQQFQIQLVRYQSTLIIFILAIGLVGLGIKTLLGNILMNLQKKSIDICQTSLLLLSPRRYTQKTISKLMTQII